jgi:hypothetical protein
MTTAVQATHRADPVLSRRTAAGRSRAGRVLADVRSARYVALDAADDVAATARALVAGDRRALTAPPAAAAAGVAVAGALVTAGAVLRKRGQR